MLPVGNFARTLSYRSLTTGGGCPAPAALLAPAGSEVTGAGFVSVVVGVIARAGLAAVVLGLWDRVRAWVSSKPGRGGGSEVGRRARDREWPGDAHLPPGGQISGAPRLPLSLTRPRSVASAPLPIR